MTIETEISPAMPETTGAMPPVWKRLRFEAAASAAEEPTLASLLNAAILSHDHLRDALSYFLAQKLAGSEMNALQIREIFDDAYNADPVLEAAAERDMVAVLDRDAACRSFLQPFLFFKGFQALQTHRVAHWLWNEGRDTLAFFFQSRVSELFGVDIHPAAQIGSGVMFDHATGIVIGETTVVGDDCSIMQGVTLGGTGKEIDDRHPKIGNGVLVSVGAKVLGNIHIGDGAVIGAGSVVLKPVSENCTVAGVPARPVGGPCCGKAESMDQNFYDEA
ncbi:serine O-acetyltransferase [Ponticaulis sp.]|uniref:serine O-acetyltransferase n=1 Tax=Ponticaulis sp. TaxID=2020902 RepID=UPI0025EF08B6|nr:serine O-acetyltransferase [Ponticaulis sp.]|tara:strand:+ start:737 stop:1564 length:828 start_codon:yes stop_codon:yes gene_type:complete